MTYYEKPTPELEELHKELGYYPKPDDFEPVPDFPEGHKHYGRPRCQAWNSYKGRQCMGLAMVSIGVDKNGKAFDKCKGCGGKTPRGIMAPTYKTGKTPTRYTQELPDRLIAKYENLIQDSTIMSMRPRAELLELRILEILETLDEGGSHQIFLKLKEKVAEYQKYAALARDASANRKADYAARAALAMNEVFRLIETGANEGQKWNEIQDITEQIRKLADTEQKQLKTAEHAVMADRVMVFATSVATIFRELIMSINAIPVEQRKKIIANADGQVSSILMGGEYPEIVDVSQFSDVVENDD